MQFATHGTRHLVGRAEAVGWTDGKCFGDGLHHAIGGGNIAEGWHSQRLFAHGLQLLVEVVALFRLPRQSAIEQAVGRHTDAEEVALWRVETSV